MKANGPAPYQLTNEDVAGLFEAAQCVVETHRALSAWLRIGMTLAEIDVFVAEQLSKHGARSCFLGYRIPRHLPFPAHSCLSLNDCIVHGHPKVHRDPVGSGDVLKIDIGVTLNGWIGDAAWTYAFGEPSDEVRELMACGKTSIRLGIAAIEAGEPLITWARALQTHVESECRFHLIRGFGGHGIGRKLHTPPFIANTVPTYPGEWPDARTLWTPGMAVALEPMIATTTGATRQEPKDWPVYTADGSMSVHYEHDVLVTEDGPRVLTEGLDDLHDVIDR
mgnify:CR=1 FL=1